MLSKLFGKKEPEPQKKFHPENRLEALLMQAAVKASLPAEESTVDFRTEGLSGYVVLNRSSDG